MFLSASLRAPPSELCSPFSYLGSLNQCYNCILVNRFQRLNSSKHNQNRHRRPLKKKPNVLYENNVPLSCELLYFQVFPHKQSQFANDSTKRNQSLIHKILNKKKSSFWCCVVKGGFGFIAITIRLVFELHLWNVMSHDKQIPKAWDVFFMTHPFSFIWLANF